MVQPFSWALPIWAYCKYDFLRAFLVPGMTACGSRGSLVWHWTETRIRGIAPCSLPQPPTDYLNTDAGEYKPRVGIEWRWQRMMSDGYNDHPDGHAQWRVDSPRSSSSRTASSRLPSSSAYDEEDGESLIAIPPNLPAWNIKRHITAGNPSPKPDSVKNLGPWRGKDNKHKTSQAILVICLNIGVDPPDIVKTNPCAVLECWIDPFSLPPSKALEAIGKNLVHQFETLNPRMKYKHYPDPSVDDTRKFCMTLRKLAKEERALFYYNGHGVPKPTASGEIWVFNRGYTQYIPVSLHDLQGWLGCPTIYVWDCSAAGHIIENFEKFARRRDEEFYQQHPDPASQANYSPYLDCVHLAACAADETLPMCPDLPADVFTSALTSPIEMALRFYVLQNQHRLSVSIEDAMKIPGDLKDRRTPLGELNWIFTAITDTIAWTAFPKDLFKRFFRQDWTLAALSRNFLLAERIMRKYNCTPRTYPALPPAHMHPLWQSWDLAVDKVMVQLPNLLQQSRTVTAPVDQNAAPPWQYENVASGFFEEHLQAFYVWLNRGGSALTKRGPLAAEPDKLPTMTAPNPNEEIVTSKPGDVIATTTGRSKPSSRRTREADLVPRKPPDQLPILLQVLLSQTHRLRALILLGNFIDLGAWAVHLALTIGIFPYVQKLLQSQARELEPVLIYIWSRVIAYDQSVQVDLLRENGHKYFTRLLKPDTILNIPNELEHRAMCGFIMAMECRDHPAGQQAALDQNFLQSCASGLESADYLMRQWSALGMALLWDRFDYGKSYAVGTLSLPDLLLSFIMDDAAEVRAAIFFALSTLYGASASSDPHRRGGDGTGSMLHLNERDHLGFELKTGVEAILIGKDDASPMVRKEVVVLFSAIVHEWRGWFVIAAWAYWEGSRSDFNDLRHQFHLISTRNTSNRASIATTASGETGRTGKGAEGDPEVVWNGIEEFIERAQDEETKSHNHTVLSSVFILYAALLDLTVDPYPEVANMAKTIADYITALLRESYFARLPTSTIDSIPPSDIPQPQGTSRSSAQARSGSSLQPGRDGPNRNSLNLTESTLSTTIKRTSSIANSIRSLAAGYAFPSVADKGHPEGDEEEAEPRSSRQPARGVALDAHPPRFEFKAAVPQPRFNLTTYLSPYPARTADRNRATPATGGGSLRSVRGGAQERQGASGSPASAPNTPKRPGGFYVPSSGRQTPSSTTGTSSPELSASTLGYTAADVIAALIEEDWERLRLRRLAGSRDQQQRQQRNQAMLQQQQLQNGQQQGHLHLSLSHLAQQQPAQTNVFRQPQNAAGAQSQGRSSAQLAAGQHANGRGPLGMENVRHAQNLSANGMQGSWMSDSSSSFVTTDSEGSGSHLALGLGSATGVANILPLKSKYFDWSMEYFTEPQMRAAEDEEPGSVVFNEQSWRGQRNDRILVETQKQGMTANRCPWDKSLTTIQNSHPVRLLKFHQFETHLITVNNDRIVSVWDWAKKKRLACFDNGNPEGTSVTSLHFVNEETQALILTACADGMVKIFNNYDPEMAFDDYPIEMCSSFRALPRLSMSEHRSGLVTDWLQPYGLLVVGGDSKTIKIWDAHKETIATVSSDIPSENSSCVTSIAADLDGAATVVAAFGDGSLGVYDRRSSRVQIRTRIYDKHSSWIQSVHWQRGSQREILSGSLDGKVILWDIRSVGGSVVEWEPFQGGLANFAVHDRSGVFAASSAIGRGVVRQQNIQVHSLPPRPHPPMMSEIKIPITSAQFQPSWQPSFFPSPSSLAFHPHEMMLGWGGYDGRIKIFGADLKRQIPSLDLPYDETDGLEEFPPAPPSVQTLEGRISPGYGHT